MIVRELVTKLGFDVDESKLKKLDSVLDKTKQNINKVSSSIDTMKKSLVTKTSDDISKRYFIDERYVEAAKESAKKIKEAAKDTKDALNQFSNVLKKTKYAVLGLVGTFSGISALSLSVAKDNVALEEMSKQLNITTKDLQTLELVAQQSGVEVGLLTKTFSKLNKDINSVSFSKSKTAKELASIGISAYTTAGKLRDSKDVFLDVAKKINNIKDTSKQAALSQKLLGTSNLDLVKSLSLNSEEFAKQSAEVLKLSYIVDSKGIKSSEEFIKSWSQFKIMINSIRQELSIKFMPTFINVINKFKDWYTDNRKLISSGIDTFVNLLSKSFDLLLKTIDLLIKPIKAIIDLFGGFENTIQILGITLGVSLIPKLLTLITTFRALGVAMFANPIGMVTLAFTALGAAIAVVYNDIDGYIKGHTSLIGFLIDEWDIFGKTLKTISSILTTMANLFDKITPKMFSLGNIFDPTGLLRKMAKENIAPEGFVNDNLNDDVAIPEKITSKTAKERILAEDLKDGNLNEEYVVNLDDYKKSENRNKVNDNLFDTNPYMNPTTGSSITDNRTIRNNITQNVGDINITVPEGTTEQQAVSINNQVVDIIQEQLSQFTLRGLDSLSNK